MSAKKYLYDFKGRLRKARPKGHQARKARARTHGWPRGNNNRRHKR